MVSQVLGFAAQYIALCVSCVDRKRGGPTFCILCSFYRLFSPFSSNVKSGACEKQFSLLLAV